MRRGRSVVSLLATVFAAGCAPPPLSQPIGGAPQPSAPPSSALPAAATLPATSGAAPASFAPAAQLHPVLVLVPAPPQTVDLTVRPDDVWERVRLGFSIPDMQSPLVVDQQAWYLSHQDYMQRSFERASRYIFHVVEELEKRHLPTELALLPFVESAYNPMAYSRAHASGMWQFIPTTGKNYNLRQDWWLDERRDVLASTDAALNYLEALYEMHGDWTLALASYNWGEGAVKRALDKNLAQGKPTDYLNLNMPEETRTYYPKLQALKNIIKNPEAFGVVLPRIENQPYFVPVENDRSMDVSTAARLADMPVDEFRALNPSFNRPVIAGAPGTTLLLPAARVPTFQANLQSHQEPLVTWEAYRVRRGERVAQVAQRFGMSVAALSEANGLTARDRLRPGQALLVQTRSGATSAASKTESLATVPNINMITRVSLPAAPASTSATTVRRVTVYVVRSGDTLSAIADQFGITADALKRSNRLHGNTIFPGQKLTVEPGQTSQAQR